ncbi:FMN-dependent dehydrogenase-domain-containing protein [Dipodascopsis uninucleata]
MPRLTGAEVEKHASKESCWVIVHGKCYDVTEFLPEHPGGQRIILRYAGKDATKEFDPIHPSDTLAKYLPLDKHLGDVDMSTVELAGEEKLTASEIARLERVKNIPPLSQCYNLLDFENVAKQVLKPTTFGYYASAADDEITMRENHNAFQRIWFRPRVLRDVSVVDYSTKMLGALAEAPFYITATGQGKLAHPDGEVALARIAAREGIHQMVPLLGSCTYDEVADAATSDQVQWLQLYVHKDRAKAREAIENAERRGCKGLWVTVDVAQVGRREKDIRAKHMEELEKNNGAEDVEANNLGSTLATTTVIDPGLCWDDIAWFKSITKMPIALKGIQCAEDALLAVESGVSAIVVSNHGGRQLEFSRPSIEILVEVMAALRRYGVADKIEVYLDSGIRRGTDVMKALCLGAKGVGIGRPLLYALSTYGEEGAIRMIQLLKSEIEMNMRLLGVTSLSQLNESYIDTSSLSMHTALPVDALSEAAYSEMQPPLFKSKL